VIVDVQEKLCGAMEPAALQAMVQNCGILLRGKRFLCTAGRYPAILKLLRLIPH